MNSAPPKIAQLVAEARTELKRLGIDTDGKRSDELLNMLREQRNNSSRLQSHGKVDRNTGLHSPASTANHEVASQ